jgi:hypothetical protein
MAHKLLFCLMMVQSCLSFAGCLNNDQLDLLKQAETTYLINKIPPVFKHSLQANLIQIDVQAIDDAECQAKLIVNLPQAEIDEAHQVLDAQPAKKIMLSAQGYALPASTKEEAVFYVDSATLMVANADVLQTAPLGKLRASIELMYAFLTQKRAEVSPSQLNSEPWPNEITQQTVVNCSAKLKEAVCTCVASEYAKTIPAHQMEYIQSIRENPYALATGAINGFELIKQKAEAACQG